MTAPSFANPKTVAPPLGAYSHVVRVKSDSDVFFISGQVGIAPDGSLPPDLAGQAENVFRNIVAILEDQGMTVANLAKVNLYIVSGQSAVDVRAMRTKVWGADLKAASTLVYVPQLVDPKYLLEIEAVAAK
jgi:enamine deaminase RidA (YjgF/YER057c/UK114 family)